MAAFYHEPVLAEESVSLLLQNKDVARSGIYVDCTLGGGGYTDRILRLTDSSVRVVAMDRDLESINFCKESLKDFYGRIFFVVDNFACIKAVTAKLFGKENEISGVVMDLGLSTYQLEHEGGFSYKKDTELDMRADKGQELTARDILNEYDEKELLRVFREYGELRYSRQITRDIIEQRKKEKFRSTFDLADLLKKKIPPRYINKDLSKAFQALRIEVNNELENLSTALNDAALLLEKGARIVVVTYHSLEDRIVKNFFRSSKLLTVLTKKPVTVSSAELRRNPRSRSAKLRAAERY